ncbi:MAG: acyltransferase [Promicromonosporaceae bacterium]|nr:acyltransferase [Promicromonosporaceae bacterium]
MATVLTPASPRSAPRTISRDRARAREIAHAHPAPRGRDRFVDAVRAVATLGIVSVHWLMPEAAYDGHRLWVGNALGHGSAWILTWVLQVLPLLFFAAGASAAYQHERVLGLRWLPVLGSRLRRVARPVVAFAGAWVVAIGVLLALGVPSQAVFRLARMAPQLLWFLGVWVVLVALTPLLVRAWRRWGVAALAVAVAAPLAVDLLRFDAGLHAAAWANVLLVWAVPYLAGIAYAERRDRLPSRGVLAGLAVLGIAGMVALVTFGPYPLSMIGMPGDAISNLAPPTAPIVAQSVAQVAVVLLVREAVVRWAQGRGRALVDLLARRSMTVYLWHLTAMFAVVGVVLLGLHQKLPVPWSADWWASRPVWVGGFVLALVGLVRLFGRFEDRRQWRGSATA